MTGIKRREFVKLGAGGALLAGCPTAAWAELQLAARARPGAQAAQPVIAPINWKQYRDLLKKRNQPGVILLLEGPKNGVTPKKPNAKNAKEAAKQRALQQQLKQLQAPGNHIAAAVHGALMSTCSSELPQLLTQAVFVAAQNDHVRREFPSIPANAGLALIGVDGKVIATLPADPQLGIKFTERAMQLLYGKDGGRLAERVKAERAALGVAECKKLDAALVELDHDEFARREEASVTLARLFDKIQASLAQAHRSAPSLEVRTRIDTMFRRKLQGERLAQHFQQSLAPHAAAAANFNVRVLCGQGALKPPAHEFVQRWCAAADARGY